MFRPLDYVIREGLIEEYEQWAFLNPDLPIEEFIEDEEYYKDCAKSKEMARGNR